ncbi:MAG TPA: hypothetical protein VFA83_18945 [Acidimicrobiales bacterium]|nr:hypothetical protein [Acidimicrobiales bacterium]
MLSPATARALVQQRQDGMLQAASRHRLHRDAPSARRQRARVALGRLLVNAGVRVAGRPRGAPEDVAYLRPYLVEPISPA